jgi:hypothetical protein
MRHVRLIAALALMACSPASEPACQADAGPNPSSCPPTYASAYNRCFGSPRMSCTPGTDPSCAYVGAGDEVGGCFATAVILCFELDAGVGEWRCAQ